ncbi:MAG TPA: heme exporter protein CcmD [Dermatophilaceae bacterium]|jgi:hypothetical protein|nr:heme exporter protein CcmD [Dermatophilaceae bacterium]
MVDYIPPQYGYPLAAILWLVLLVMILKDRRKLNRELKQRPSPKILNRQTGEWVDYNAPPSQEIFDQDEFAHRFGPSVRPASEIPNPPKGSSV